MDHTTTPTTRKGFLQRAGLAVAGMLALTNSSQAKTAETVSGSRTAEKTSAMRRVRVARGAVERNSVQ
ncbi:hypothetical protein [Coraliomargarita akajimensis]|uniref:Twin-arginine translocation signal domain-containing protein n=1 Tax=Coraliomargarita akajimensis (strain DSM 45221 / IAM 15411 / JCM 23193 / KCTC 12865 / 04OKA010-24) TaxID=583355 RepID=D5EKG4_CORAD|nr:hypothetical protein [Coraliomargarita akajimensis]ADE53045.1 hypothetical protein Caka_0016 [Coraliomargarita akajimensis DSM 45221]